MREDTHKKIIIEGVTQSGSKFRPSNWAQRVCGMLCSFRGHRIHYSPLLRPSTSEKGFPCVVMDPDLETKHPAIFKEVMQFASHNSLTVHNQSSPPSEGD